MLGAKQLAEAALHYARVTKAADETQADCLRIITRSETRMADEVDAAQELGQLPRRGGNRSKVRTADFGGEASHKRRVDEWRAVRDAGEQFVEDVLRAALAEGRTPTKREIVDGAKTVRHELKGRAATPRVAKGEDTRRRPTLSRAGDTLSGSVNGGCACIGRRTRRRRLSLMRSWRNLNNIRSISPCAPHCARS